MTRKWLFVVVGVHVKGQVVQLKRERVVLIDRPLHSDGSYLVKCLVADIALVSLLPAMGQTVVLVVALLVEPLATELTTKGLVAVVDSHVRVQRGAPARRRD